MKVLLIPDVHGRHSWMQPVRAAIKSRDTHIVFLGDYVDSFDIKGYKILQNLRDIIAIKKKFPERVTLLLGNHDYAYIHGFFQISGFNSAMMFDYKEIFEKYKDYFELAWGYSGKKYTLVTHAGLTQGFYDVLQKKIEDKKDIMHSLLVKFADHKYDSWDQMPVHELLNYFKDQKEVMWHVSNYRGGSQRYGSILWADMRELLDCNIKGIDQIVGHTNLSNTYIKQKDEDTLYFIDASTSEHLSLFYIDLE